MPLTWTTLSRSLHNSAKSKFAVHWSSSTYILLRWETGSLEVSLRLLVFSFQSWSHFFFRFCRTVPPLEVGGKTQCLIWRHRCPEILQYSFQILPAWNTGQRFGAPQHKTMHVISPVICIIACPQLQAICGVFCCVVCQISVNRTKLLLYHQLQLVWTCPLVSCQASIRLLRWDSQFKIKSSFELHCAWAILKHGVRGVGLDSSRRLRRQRAILVMASGPGSGDGNAAP